MAEGLGALSLKPGVLEECVQFMAAAHPKEACALLIGERSPNEHRVEELVSIPNVAEREDEFELDPVAWRQAELEARAAGLEVLGVWHSHPRAEATLSARDRAKAQPGWSYAITAGSEPERIRSFLCLDDRTLVEQRVTTRAHSCAARL